MWDIQSNRVTNFTGHRGEVSAVAMSDDGGLIVSGGRDRSIRVWATGSKNNRSDNSWTTAISTNGAVTDVKLSGEDYIVSGEADGYVRIYSTATGAMTTNTRCWLKGNTKYSPGAVMRVALQNTNITTSGKARKFNDVQVFDHGAGACVLSEFADLGWGFRMSFSPDRRRCCCCAVRLHAG